MESGGTVFKARSGTCSGLPMPMPRLPGQGWVFSPAGRKTWWSRWTSNRGGFVLSGLGLGSVCLVLLVSPLKFKGCCDLSGPGQGSEVDGEWVRRRWVPWSTWARRFKLQLGFFGGGACGKMTRYLLTSVLIAALAGFSAVLGRGGSCVGAVRIRGTFASIH